MEEKVITETPAPTPALESMNTILLNDEAIKRLKSIVKWSNVLVIINVVLLATGIIFSLFSGKIIEKIVYLTGQTMPPMSTASYLLDIIFNLVVCGIVFVPYYFLHKFTKKAKTGLIEKDENQIMEAFADQDKFFKILAAYMIAVLALFAIFLIGMILIVFMVA